MKYYNNVVFPSNAKSIIDVTKPPYSLDPTGKEDCTEKLKELLNDLMRPIAEDMQKVYDMLKDAPDGTYVSNENKKMNGKIYGIMPNALNQVPIIYFPDGTYLVSDTITYTLRNLHNTVYHFTPGGMELNRCIRFMGQSREKTIIKLEDNCKGFGFGQMCPVFNFMPAERSNVSMSNYFENITVDVGKGNPGAVGIVFFANNSGAIRNVTIKSSDDNHDGYAGLLIEGEHLSACNVYDTTIDGFTYGVLNKTFTTFSHFERITLKNQTKYGMRVDNNSVQIIGLKAYLDVPALYSKGSMCHMVVSDAEIVSNGSIFAAIKYERGIMYLHNIRTKGFKVAYEERWFAKTIPDGYIEEFCNKDSYTLFDDKAKTIGMVVPPLPDVGLESDFDKWSCVNDFGAVGDGKHDDTDAIAAAFASGKPVIWFQPGHYLIKRPIDIPETVKHIHYMFCDIVAGDELRQTDGEAVFHIVGESEETLLIEKLFSWNECIGRLRMFRQDNKRTIFMRDVHTQACATYFNTVPGAELFFENCACTIGKKDLYSDIPGFEFNGQTVWCHSINPERSLEKVVNRGGKLWWSGFKTEQVGPICATYDGGVTEILGGVAVSGTGEPYPLIVNIDSDVSAIFDTSGLKLKSIYPIAVRETRGGITKEIYDYELPERNRPWYFMTLYSGRGKQEK